MVRKRRTVVIVSAPGQSSLLVVFVVVLAGEVAGDPHAVAMCHSVRFVVVRPNLEAAVGGLVAQTPVGLPVAARRHPDVCRHDARLPRLLAEPPARVVL